MPRGISTGGVNLPGNVNEQVNVLNAIRPENLAAGAKNGIVIDRRLFNTALVKVVTGLASGTPTTTAVAWKLQHSTASDGSGMVDAAVGRIGVVTQTIADDAASNQITGLLDLMDLNRFIRIVVTPAFTGGSTPKVLTSVTVVTGEFRGDGPLTQQAEG